MRRRVRDAEGMTLVELMIVVVIIGILAALAVVGYHKYVARSRLSEANAMLAELAAKEQLYFLDNGQYVEAHHYSTEPGPGTTLPYPSTEENAVEFWPQNPNDYWDSSRQPVSVYDSGGNMPFSWRTLGLRPRWRQLYCTYMVNAGGPGDAPPGAIGPIAWATTPQVPWFYAFALCNLVGQAGWNADSASLGKETALILTSDSPALQTIDESR